MKITVFTSEETPEIPSRIQSSKAPEDWRSPRCFARNECPAQRGSVLECGGPPPLFKWVVISAMMLLIALGATAQTTNALSDTEIRGHQLALQLLEQTPDTNLFAQILEQGPAKNAFGQTGVLQIRDKKGSVTNIPIQIEIIVTPEFWEAIYLANESPGYLKIVHKSGQPNQYSEVDPQIMTPVFERKLLNEDQTMIPFANSDFWLCDLGLEFLHWPDQDILRGETMRGVFCKVLESTNPNPSTNDYSRVVTWIDNESLGIVQAKAYDAKGKLLKDFYPKDIKKVDGQWQVGSMEIDNVQTRSRSTLKFDLNKK